MHPGPAQAQKPAVAGKRQLGLDDLVAAIVVAEQRLGARGDPLDRPADAASGPDRDRFLRVDRALHAEAAADIASDHSYTAFRDMQDLMGKAVPHAMHILRAGVERVAGGPGIVVGNAATRLHRNSGNPVVDQ